MSKIVLSNPNPNILLVRPDNIGDVLLTTPAVKALKKQYPGASISFLCRSYTAPLLKGNPGISQIISINDYSFLGLVKVLKEKSFDAVIHFFVEPNTVLATFLAGIPVRIGPFSKLSSILLNHRITQNRSMVQKHEADYNLELVESLGTEIEGFSPEIYLNAEEKKRGEKIIIGAKLSTKKPLVIMHPGSKGSAQEWPLEHFIRLALWIASKDYNVLFTAGTGEERIIERVNIKIGTEHTHIRAYPAGRLALKDLASVISYSKLMISNSTGPLHMAVSLGIPTVSFFPNFPLQTTKKRWGPYGLDHQNQVLVPNDGVHTLSSISVDDAFEAVMKSLPKPKVPVAYW